MTAAEHHLLPVFHNSKSNEFKIELIHELDDAVQLVKLGRTGLQKSAPRKISSSISIRVGKPSLLITIKSTLEAQKSYVILRSPCF